MSMNNTNGRQNETQVQQDFLLRRLGAPLLLVTYKSNGAYFGRPSKDRVQVKPMAVGLKNAGMADVIVWQLKQHDGGSQTYTYAKEVMEEIFGQKKNAGETKEGLSKAELQARGLAIETLISDAHQVKIGKDYSDEIYQALAESFAQCWQEIGAPQDLAEMIVNYIGEWIAEGNEVIEEETEVEEEEEEVEV